MAHYGGWYHDDDEIKAWADEAPEQLVRVMLTTRLEDPRDGDLERDFGATRRNAAKALLMLYESTYNREVTRWDWEAVKLPSWTLLDWANEFLQVEYLDFPDAKAIYDGDWTEEDALLEGLRTGHRPKSEE